MTSLPANTWQYRDNLYVQATHADVSRECLVWTDGPAMQVERRILRYFFNGPNTSKQVPIS